MPLGRVLRQFAIAPPLVSKDVLDDVKRVLNLRSNIGLELLELLAQPSYFRIGRRTALAGAHSNSRRHLAVLIFLALLNTLVARIAKGHGLVAVPQRPRLSDVNRSNQIENIFRHQFPNRKGSHSATRLPLGRHRIWQIELGFLVLGYTFLRATRYRDQDNPSTN